MTITGTRTDHLATAARYAADPDRWPVAPRFSPRGRWYHRLAQDDDHEVWLLTWLPGQGTGLHDHGGSAGAFLVISGSLVEDTLAVETTPLAGPPKITARELAEGAGRRFGPRHIHRVTNSSARPAVSVHVYAPALTTMTRYRIADDGLDVVSVDRAGAQW
jgi:predicted metal-dependent enzyme (double-stranded beta helix superfamily)